VVVECGNAAYLEVFQFGGLARRAFYEAWLVGHDTILLDTPRSVSEYENAARPEGSGVYQVWRPTSKRNPDWSGPPDSNRRFQLVRYESLNGDFPSHLQAAFGGDLQVWKARG